MTYPPFAFPHGRMWGVYRRTTPAGRFGSLEGPNVGFLLVGEVGPCNAIEGSRTDTAGENQAGSPNLDVRLGIPVGSDVRSGDRLKDLASGELFDVIGEPETPTNPFTGWQPRTYVGLRRTRYDGK